MHSLQLIVPSHGPAHDKVETLVLAVKTTKMRLKNVHVESQLLADCHTVEKLVSKLDQIVQDKWFHYCVLKLQLLDHVSFEA